MLGGSGITGWMGRRVGLKGFGGLAEGVGFREFGFRGLGVWGLGLKISGMMAQGIVLTKVWVLGLRES